MSVINTNIQAITAARNLNRSQEMLGRALTRLSSGSKIVNPSDDAAGLAVSEKLDAQNKRVKAATTNVQNAVSLVQTADGFMSGMTKILSRMSELAILAKDVTKNSSDVALYSKEFTALQDQLRQTIGGSSTEIGGADVDTPLGQFNGIKLFGSTGATPLPTVVAGAYSIGTTPTRDGLETNVGSVTPPTIGANATIGNNAKIGGQAQIGSGAVLGNDVSIGAGAYIGPGTILGDGVIVDPGVKIYSNQPIAAGTHVRSDILPPGPGHTVTVGQAVGQTMTIPDINLRDGAMADIIKQDSSGNYLLNVTDEAAIGSITNSIQDVANERASLGASQSRLELAATTLQVEYENLESAISRIRDVDVADESTQYARYNILVQSGTAMLAQANQTPQSVLKLLQG